MATSNDTILRKALQDNGISLSDDAQQQLLRYLDLMHTWNRVFNLTSITEPRDMIMLHLIDSLAVSPFLHGERMLDVGSGAGLPGIPLAIMNPQQQWTLLDKNNKKTRFLTQVAAELKLKNVSVAHIRSEDFQPESCFDSILSRAYATINLFAQTTEHLLCPTGLLIAMKGKYPQDELNDITEAFKLRDITRLEIKGMTIERHIVRLERTIV